MIKYLGEIETKFENILACLSEAQMGSNHEKTGGQKSYNSFKYLKFLAKKNRI